MQGCAAANSRAQITSSRFILISPRRSFTQLTTRMPALLQIGNDIFGILDTDRKAYDLGAGAGGRTLRVRELAMRRRGRMNDEAADIADVGEMREQPQRRDERDAGLISTFEAEREHGARPLGNETLGQRMIGARGQTGIVHPGDLVVLLEPGRDFEGVVGVALHPQRQRFEPVSRRKALNGEIAGPMSRSPMTRQAMAKAKLPKVSANTMPL